MWPLRTSSIVVLPHAGAAANNLTSGRSLLRQQPHQRIGKTVATRTIRRVTAVTAILRSSSFHRARLEPKNARTCVSESAQFSPHHGYQLRRDTRRRWAADRARHTGPDGILSVKEPFDEIGPAAPNWADARLRSVDSMLKAPLHRRAVLLKIRHIRVSLEDVSERGFQRIEPSLIMSPQLRRVG